VASLSRAAAVGGWEGLAVAIVIVARNDAHKGSEEARHWLATVAPMVLGWVFVDMDPATFTAHLNVPRPVERPAKKGRLPRKRAA
jgi:uncharacterized membrane protein